MYKCAAYNPVTQEVKTSGSSDRLRVRRKGRGLPAGGRGLGASGGPGVSQPGLQLCVPRGVKVRVVGLQLVGHPGLAGKWTPTEAPASHSPALRLGPKELCLLLTHLRALWGPPTHPPPPPPPHCACGELSCMCNFQRRGWQGCVGWAGQWHWQRAASAWERRAGLCLCPGHQSARREFAQHLPLVKTGEAHTVPRGCENSCVC